MFKKGKRPNKIKYTINNKVVSKNEFIHYIFNEIRKNANPNYKVGDKNV